MTTFNIYQKGIHYMGIKMFNNLPQSIKDVSNNARNFEICLKRFLHKHSFYSIEEYLQQKIDQGATNCLIMEKLL
jgi:hypothetical protein